MGNYYLMSIKLAPKKSVNDYLHFKYLGNYGPGYLVLPHFVTETYLKETKDYILFKHTKYYTRTIDFPVMAEQIDDNIYKDVVTGKLYDTEIKEDDNRFRLIPVSSISSSEVAKYLKLLSPSHIKQYKDYINRVERAFNRFYSHYRPVVYENVEADIKDSNQFLNDFKSQYHSNYKPEEPQTKTYGKDEQVLKISFKQNNKSKDIYFKDYKDKKYK